MYQFSKRSKRRMQGVHPDLVLIANEAIKASPIDFGIPEHGGVRTAEVQRELFEKDVSPCDGTDRISKHQQSLALDIYAYIGGKASWNKVHLAMVATVFMLTAERLYQEGKITSKIKWGGTFGSSKFHGYDYPHFEIIE